MNDRQLRIKHIRVLEIFFNRTIYLLKINNFNFELFRLKTIKNYREISKLKEVTLSSPYLISLKKFIANVINSINNKHIEIKELKNNLLKEANLLQKIKKQNSYKKDKHKNHKFNDEY